jgi:hypothetical protein
MLVALIISALLALSLGVLSMISAGTGAKYKSEMEIYVDIAYGFKLMQKHVREMEIARDPLPPAGAWTGERLYIDNRSGKDGVFGLYQNAAADSVDFVFVPDQDDESAREVLLSLPNPATVALNITRSGNAYTVHIEGEKDAVPFDMSTVILKRRRG